MPEEIYSPTSGVVIQSRVQGSEFREKREEVGVCGSAVWLTDVVIANQRRVKRSDRCTYDKG